MAYSCSVRVVAFVGNLSLQWVNSSSFILNVWLVVKGGLIVDDALMIHNIFGLSRARHMHLGR